MGTEKKDVNNEVGFLLSSKEETAAFQNTEVSTQFLTSDNFRIISKKKSSKKKSGEVQETSHQLDSKLEEFGDNEEQGRYASFWMGHSSSEEHADVTHAEEKLIPNKESPFVKPHEIIVKKRNKENKSIAEESTAPSSTKSSNKISKNRKKHCHKTQSEEEIEKILKEIEEIDRCKTGSAVKKAEKGAKKPVSTGKSSNGSLILENEKSGKKNDDSVLGDANKPMGAPSEEYPTSCSDVLKSSSNDLSESATPESDSAPNPRKSSSQKRKEKRLRQKMKKNNRVMLLSSSSSEFTSGETEITIVQPSGKSIPIDDAGDKAANSSPTDDIGYCSDNLLLQQGEPAAKKKDKARPSKKMISSIMDAIKRAEEEQLKKLQEEESRKRLAEEMERQRQELVRREQEKKDKKKIKVKQKRDKMRAEGKLLSKSQKLDRARFSAMLAGIRQQGIDIPHIGEHRPRRRFDSTRSEFSERQKSGSLSSQGSFGKGSTPDIPSSLESKDSGFSLMGSVLSRSDDSLERSLRSGQTSGKENEIPKDTLVNMKPNALCDNKSSDKSKAKHVPLLSKDPRLRSPVVCVLGHVDTGKTKILDQIRKTHVQASEAGGITQQIGATMIPRSALMEKCSMVAGSESWDLKVPGLLVIDTPGHESFCNLRSRGASVCDIAVLVVDVMHGLEPQTLESIRLLKAGRVPFVVALNKVDRLYGWKSQPQQDIETTISSQSGHTAGEFQKRCQEIIAQFAEQCLNAALCYENRDPRHFVSMVPTSAITGDGMGNLLHLVADLSQSLMSKKLVFSNELEATVLEVKVIPGLGTTVDVILVNGRLRVGDTVVLAGQDGPVVTQVRSLLMPQPLKELRVKNPYVEHKSVEGAQGVKVTARDLDKCVAGMPLLVADGPDQVEEMRAVIQRLIHLATSRIRTCERGVYVQASTLGSLEALVGYLSSADIPYHAVKVGPVVKKDVMKASVMLEHDILYACILAFDVKVERDAQELADTLGVKIFQADIIYHLFDAFVGHQADVQRAKEEIRHKAIFPCKLRVQPDSVAMTPDNGETISLSIAVERGTLKLATPLSSICRPSFLLGSVSSISVGGQPVPMATSGQVADLEITRPPREGHRSTNEDAAQKDSLRASKKMKIGEASRPRRDSVRAMKSEEFLRSNEESVKQNSGSNKHSGRTRTASKSFEDLPSTAPSSEDSAIKARTASQSSASVSRLLRDSEYLVSRITRQSSELCREHYRDEVDWELASELKALLASDH